MSEFLILDRIQESARIILVSRMSGVIGIRLSGVIVISVKTLQYLYITLLLTKKLSSGKFLKLFCQS